MYLGSSIYYGDEMRELIILQKYGVLFNYVYCGIRVCVCVCVCVGGVGEGIDVLLKMRNARGLNC